MKKEKSKLWLYETVVDSFEFFFWSILKHEIPEGKREGYKSEVIKGLEAYIFKERTKKGPLHPNSMALKKERKTTWIPLDYQNPKDVVRAILTIMNPYYVASTQNRVKIRLEKNLNLFKPK